MNRPQATDLAVPGSAHDRETSPSTGSGHDVAILAGLQIMCFLALTRLEPRFFLIHLYQLIPYVAILILVGYGQARWAYMISSLVSMAWFALAYLAGLLGSAVEHLRTFRDNRPDSNFVAVLALVTALVAVLMTALTRIHWVKEFSGRVPTRRMLLVTLAVVVAYYLVLLHWFLDMIPNA